MIVALSRGRLRAQHSLALPFRRAPCKTKETLMTWTTPAAIDHRFGFEISLYVSNR